VEGIRLGHLNRVTAGVHLHKQSLFVLVLLVALVAGCASGPLFQRSEAPEDNEALLYVYRPMQLLASGYSPDIYVNGEKALTLVNGGYSLFRLKPGKFTVIAKGFVIPGSGNHYGWAVEMGLEPGKTYYVRWKPGLSGIPYRYPNLDFQFRGHMEILDEQRALAEISECRYLDPAKATIHPVNEVKAALDTKAS
jgi:hypothetical protein